MPDNVLAFMIALGVALILMPVVIAFARRTGALDKPDARKVHEPAHRRHRDLCRVHGVHSGAAYFCGTDAGIHDEPDRSHGRRHDHCHHRYH